MVAYYNEHDPYAAAWLRNLITAGMIAPGDVDERDILDVRPSDLAGFSQHHFFAGIGGWSLALRLAGWPDDQPIWTASCPCQPFSAAGKGAGFADERHLWPALHWLIERCNPPIVMGEQVASPDGLAWLDLVSADCEGAGYAVRATDLCAAGVGAPHIRQRLYWAARMEYAKGHGRDERRTESGGRCAASGCSNGWMGHGQQSGLEGYGRHGNGIGEPGRIVAPAAGSVATSGDPGGLADLHAGGRDQGREGRETVGYGQAAESDRCADAARPGPVNSFWRDADWLFCRDGKWRPVEPGTFPLAYGISARVGRLRAYGNAIVPQVAAEFIRMLRAEA